MDQLFVIQRYKPLGEVKSEDDKKKEFNAALDDLLRQAKTRQQLQEKIKTSDTKIESPRTVIKRKLFRSPESLKGLKKIRHETPTTSAEKENSIIELNALSTDSTNNISVTIPHGSEKKKSKKKRIANKESKDDNQVDVNEEVLPNESVVEMNLSSKDTPSDPAEEPSGKPKKKLKLFRNKRNKQTDTKSVNDGEVNVKDRPLQDSDINNTISSDQMDTELKRKDVDSPEGFTVIGEVMKKSSEPVTRMLPNWLAQPTVLSSNLQDKKMPVRDINMLHPSLLSALETNGITHFFPVQQEVITWVLNSLSTASFFRPRDICVSAPTGSGKTLSYVLPIIHAIMNRLVPVVRVLVVLPVKDLAKQVFKVFQNYIKTTNLKVALISGNKPHAIEAKRLVQPNVKGGFSSLVDIVIATPGSLIHHIQRTEGFSLHNLRFLVVDEADRMIEDIQEGWLSVIEKAIQSKKMHSCQCRGKPNSGRLLSGPIIPCCLKRPVEPCQKMLFSATLSHDPEKLKMLSLFCPKLFTTVVTSKYHIDHKQEMVEKFSTPEELTEITMICEAQMKPLTLWYLLLKKHHARVLCFTNTVENSHRLALLLTELGDINVRELSSNLKDQQRQSILNQFSSGKIDILICSDMMARGMDLDNVQCVINYDPPLYIKTYIHRIGRTARAGLTGTALSLLYKGEQKEFNKLMRLGNRPLVTKVPFDSKLLDIFQEHYQDALRAVSAQLSEYEQKVRRSRNIFQKSRKT